ncbi:sulfatase family protein [Segetibacter aerophilus]|uniref:Acetylglucosamine-6-sulfatase n=1 Tax=Segetibacter aerophilus TaxID=670293 RepID=A0A512BES9_9BACT|nr:sulfatase [Segetibacter aerophilus]GEO10471.1 acetylglucosamine-6-sulfatase [Segetibacter aerophilus]
MKNYQRLLKNAVLLIAVTCSISFIETSVYAQAKATKQIVYNKIAGVKPRNIIYILSDDHRYDFMGFTGRVPGLETPNMDRLAKEGAYLQNAFVTTALCSPSRASILTGQYAHTHTVVDNQSPAPASLIYFPQYLQKLGYQTSFFGKWHMGGETDEPRPGFNRWVSFRGQGVYYNPLLNIDGKHVQYKDSAYITDLLTDLSLDWLKQRDKSKPFFLYLSHKAVHEREAPAKRDLDRYKNLSFLYPVSMYTTATPTSKKFTRGKQADGSQYKFNNEDIPNWVRAQRYSWHGVDYMYNETIEFDEFYQRYLETLMGVDNSIGRVMDYLKENGLDKETLVVYMGDNGFAFGEHGLIDKRQAYEESMRVPLLARCPELIKPGTVVKEMVLNLDIAPTFLEMAGISKPAQMQGNSFLPLLQNKQVPWRDRIYYEYYWENAFPQTPTQYAVRTDQYKFIRTQGVWDIDQLFDIQKDPFEVNNLIRSPQHQQVAKQLNKELWDWLEKSGGMQIPLKRINEVKNDHKHRGTW